MADKPKKVKLWFSPDVAVVVEASAKDKHLPAEKYLLSLAQKDLSDSKTSPRHNHHETYKRS